MIGHHLYDKMSNWQRDECLPLATSHKGGISVFLKVRSDIVLFSGQACHSCSRNLPNFRML